MIAVCKTHQGRVRPNNQDAYLAIPGAYPLYVVADGMGGHRGGNVASKMAVDCLAELDVSQPPSRQAFHQAVQKANRDIFERQQQDLSLSGMGTTLTGIWVGTDGLLIAHVGDSRAYRLRDGVLSQVTTDHSLVGELLRSGAITAQQARTYPYRNIVTRAVGTEKRLRCDLMEEKKQAGDRWLLCSDGLTEYAGTDQLLASMLLPLEEAAERLMNIALEGGGQDNITLILLEVAP